MGQRETATSLLDTVGALVEQPCKELGTAWPRIVAHLARQALEDLLGRFWSRRAPGTEQTTLRAQLTCLPYYLDEGLAERVAYTWTALSRACHHHESELLPTASELRNWVAVVVELDGIVGGRGDR